jgi:hypothetical protein
MAGGSSLDGFGPGLQAWFLWAPPCGLAKACGYAMELPLECRGRGGLRRSQWTRSARFCELLPVAWRLNARL